MNSTILGVSGIERFRLWFEQECDSDAKMLEMIASVPEANRTGDEFLRTVRLAAHLAACRENWLDRMSGDGRHQVAWFSDEVDFESLAPRFETLHAEWTAYLDSLTDEDLAADFTFPLRGGKTFRWSIEGQLVQLAGHSFYHRGQIAILVDMLGGETIETDYLYWAVDRDPHYGVISE